MKIDISVSNGLVEWTELVGKEHNEFGYTVIINSYSSQSKAISISEFYGGYPYTSEITTVDKDRCIAILSEYGFEINLINKFPYSNETIYKMMGLQQAGFSNISYEDELNKLMVDGIFEVAFLTPAEKTHLLEITNSSNNTISIDDIVNKGV